MSKLKKNILRLRRLGKSFRQIEKELGCNRGLISYHCSKGQKEKFRQRLYSSRRIKKEFFVKLLGGKCERCGYDRYLEAFDFHHRHPDEKDIEIGDAIRQDLEVAKKEILKCMLLCANCHREIHADINTKKFKNLTA